MPVEEAHFCLPLDYVATAVAPRYTSYLAGRKCDGTARSREFFSKLHTGLS